MSRDQMTERLMADIERVDAQYQDACKTHAHLHRELAECIDRHNKYAEEWKRAFRKYKSVADRYERSNDERDRQEANALASEANALLEKMSGERSNHNRLDPAHADAKARMIQLAEQKDDLLSQLAARPVSEGTMFQRGPVGRVPKGLSTRDRQGHRKDEGTVGAEEHVTVYGEGWHRSWDNPGTRGDHSTDHQTGEQDQH